MTFTFVGYRNDIILSYYSDESFVTRGKPDPEIYIKAAAALGMPNERCIVFEDFVRV